MYPRKRGHHHHIQLPAREQRREVIPHPLPDGGAARALEGDNKVVGRDIRVFGCEGCLVHAEGTGTVVVSGLKDYIVAVNGRDILVCPLSEEQKVKEYSSPLEKQ